MSFSCKVVLAYRGKEDGTHRVCVQAIIDRKRAVVPLEFYLQPSLFDKRRQAVKEAHPNHHTLTTELISAVAKSTAIASRYRIEGKLLTPDIFREEFQGTLVSASPSADFVKFIEKELELRKPSIAPNTFKQHKTLVNKLKLFKKGGILFPSVDADLIQKFKNSLIATKLGGPTVEKLMKVLKYYTVAAQKRHLLKTDPFANIKIRAFKSTRGSLSQDEVDKLDLYYESPGCTTSHRTVLRYFLFSCYTGVRISDISNLNWSQVHDDLLIFIPEKTKYANDPVTIPLGLKDKKYLPEVSVGTKGPIFKTFTDQGTNRILKQIVTHVGIKKKVTYHTSRHTFGSLFAEGGNIVALQRMMGHGDIKTTMGYVHTSTKALVDAKKERFG